MLRQCLNYWGFSMLFRDLLSRRDLFKSVLVAFFIIAILLPVHKVHALGVGEVNTQSYIGQPFSAWVPLLNVRNRQDVRVQITPSSTGSNLDTSSFRSQIVELDNQLNIRITSNQPVNEPYLIFSLELTESGQVVTRDYTVLLEVRPELQAQSGLSTPITSTSQANTSFQTNSRTTFQGNPSAVAYVDTPAILGPYEYAVEGQIPRQFGAVLDGQSLWRVARRINEAMGVSINQMMWALYVNNPNAFATESVDSLRAGQYLNIPTFSEVARVGDAQALSNLERLSTGQYVTNSQSSAAFEPTQNSQTNIDIPQTELVDEPIATTENAELSNEEDSESVDDSFRLSGLDELNSEETDEQSLGVINSLAETVGNLTQELIRKDKQIEFLEEKVLALESIAALGADPSDAGPSNGQQTNANVTPLASNNNNAINTANTNIQPSMYRPWFVWLALLLLALLATLLLRKRFANVFSRQEDIEFNQRPITTGNPNLQQGPQVNPLQRDYSKLAVKKENDTSEGFSYVSVNDSENSEMSISEDTEMSLDAEELEELDELSESFITVEEEDFDGYLTSLIESKRYDSALEFLENQRSNMDADRYHLERLGVYFVQRDKEAFYAYYDEIETTIQHFNDTANRRISEMVVALEDQIQQKV